ncbi:MAG: LysR family transcriptional regulator [Rhodospirillum sp.]|nr:LysR family transcriptional regulator [Rhodospirillum sp.]MCF8490572.1 LysR family transcriptional regulator [Rhodospirillum sp.]
MELKQLRYFASVARAGSFNKASVKLRIAQPALSRHIQTLEYRIGAQLFVRTPKGVELTEAGQRLLENVDFILHFVSEIKNNVNKRSAEPSGEIVLGLSPSVASLIAHRVLRRVKEAFPLVKLHIVEGLSVVLYDWLEESKVDLAVVTDFGPVAGVEQMPIAQDEIVLIGDPDTLAGHATGETIEPRDIAKLPLVLTQGFHQLIAGALWDEGIELSPEMEISSTPIVIDVVRRGGYCSIVGLSFVDAEVKAGTLVALHLAGPPVQRRILVAQPNNRPASLALQSVKDLVIDEVLKLNVTPLAT